MVYIITANKEQTERINRKLKEKNITIQDANLPLTKVCTVKLKTGYFIGIDKSLKAPERKAAIYHELGHIFTNAFYDIGEPSRTEQEQKAEQWSIEHLCTHREYKNLIKQGYDNAIKLAKQLEITTELADKIIKHYDNILI